MYRLVTSSRFKKLLKTFLHQHADVSSLVTEKMALLQQNPHAASLKSHKLTGKLKGRFACSITFGYRLVFRIQEKEIHLLAIGTHDEVY